MPVTDGGGDILFVQNQLYTKKRLNWTRLKITSILLIELNKRTNGGKTNVSTGDASKKTEFEMT